MRVLYKHLTIEGFLCDFVMSHNAKKRHAKKYAQKHGKQFKKFTTVWVNNRGIVQY